MNTDWKQILFDSAYNGKFTGTVTAVAAAVCGFIEKRDAISPLNAVSHIAWGDEAFRQSAPSLKYTLVGLVLNESANMSWAALFSLLVGDKVRRGNATAALLGGAAVSSIAYVTDYHVVPKRLTPGFEEHLSKRSLFIVYVVLALALAWSGWSKRDEDEPEVL